MTDLRGAPMLLADWPEVDRALWLRATSSKQSLFDDAGRAQELSPFTRRNYERANGLWLAHLAAEGLIDPTVAPATRITAARLDSWLDRLRGDGRANGALRHYLTCLHAFLRLVEPAAELGFMVRPGGQPLSVWLPATPKPFPPVDTEDVMARMHDHHQRGLAATSVFERRGALRDAALMALWLRRAPRVGSVAAMRIGIHLLPRPDDRFEVRFPTVNVKTRRILGWFLDEEAARCMADYLAHGRLLFPGAAVTDALWLGHQGKPLTDVGLAAIFRRRTGEWLGTSVGPHTARKWLRTSAARRSPEAAFDAATVCGHSPRVSLLHYMDAVEIGAAERHATRIARLRRQTAGLARRALTARPHSRSAPS